MEGGLGSYREPEGGNEEMRSLYAGLSLMTIGTAMFVGQFINTQEAILAALLSIAFAVLAVAYGKPD